MSANYFQALGIPVLAGRTFGAEETLESPRVTIVSERVARALWPALIRSARRSSGTVRARQR